MQCHPDTQWHGGRPRLGVERGLGVQGGGEGVGRARKRSHHAVPLTLLDGPDPSVAVDRGAYIFCVLEQFCLAGLRTTAVTS